MYVYRSICMLVNQSMYSPDCSRVSVRELCSIMLCAFVYAFHSYRSDDASYLLPMSRDIAAVRRTEICKEQQRNRR